MIFTMSNDARKQGEYCLLEMNCTMSGEALIQGESFGGDTICTTSHDTLMFAYHENPCLEDEFHNDSQLISKDCNRRICIMWRKVFLQEDDWNHCIAPHERCLVMVCMSGPYLEEGPAGSWRWILILMFIRIAVLMSSHTDGVQLYHWYRFNLTRVFLPLASRHTIDVQTFCWSSVI